MLVVASGFRQYGVRPKRNQAANVVKPIYVLLVGSLILWLQPWSEATATPQYSRAEVGRSHGSDRCLSGFRKSTTTGKCVRIGFRFPAFRWS